MNSCIVCMSSTHRYWWTLELSVCLLLTDIDELLYCLSVRQYKSSSISVSRRQTDNTRGSQYLWVEDRQTIQEVVNICGILMNSCIVCLSSTHGYWWTLALSVCLLLKDIDELLYCLSVFYSQILMNSWRRTDNTRVHQYPWVEDRQTIQEFINIRE
jgi:hypothetical protein